MLLKVAWELVKPSLGELTEKSLPEETEKEILDIICSDPAVSHPHNLRTRRIGNRIAIEVHVRMDGDMPLREAHNKASLIERKLRDRFGPQTHVTVHTEPLKD